MGAFNAFIQLLCVYALICLCTTVTERHDFIKSIISDLDDTIVEMGLISDVKLHHIGTNLGICKEYQGGIKNK